VQTKSLFQCAVTAAQEHKYFESQRAGHDVGARAINEWQQRHWTVWLRHRWVEHLMGETCWEEFERERFGRLRALFSASPDLLAEVIDQVRQGAENVDVLRWAALERRDIDTVVRILCELRLNEIRCTRACFAFAQLLP
jgi:hypothetical protein